MSLIKESERSFLNTIYSLESIIRALVPSNLVIHQTTEGQYPFIPLNTTEFVSQIRIVVKYLGDKKYPFYDFGSGPGTKLIIAKQFGNFPFCVGYEINDSHVEIPFKVYMQGCTIVRKDLLNLVEGDIPTVPIVAYYYCPLSNHDLQIKFEQRLEDLLPVGSILIGNLKRDNRISKDPRFKRILSDNYNYNDNIFEKIDDKQVS